MLKLTLITALSLALGSIACAQSDTAVYYLKKSGKTVSTKDSADYYWRIYPSGSASDGAPFVATEYYMNGRVKWAGLSKTYRLPVEPAGGYTAFFPNGNKMAVRHFNIAEQAGVDTDYYPNGNFYYSMTLSAGKTMYNECRDSIGKILATNGNGKWITYNGNDFAKNKIEGQVVNGRQDGEWSSKINDSLRMTTVYQNGEQKAMYQTGADGLRTYYMLQTIPEFPGGPQAFSQFLGQNIVYPILARQNNTHGRVIITFVVDEEGKLTKIKVLRGIGSGCDEEAVRVLKLSPLWTPGMVDNKAVRVQYSVPISFSLGK
jgi:TonB family protein